MNKKNLLAGYFLSLAILLVPVFSTANEKSADFFPLAADRFGLTSEIGADFGAVQSRGIGGVFGGVLEMRATTVLGSPQLKNKQQESAKGAKEKAVTFLLENERKNVILSNLREKNYQPLWEGVQGFISVLKTEI